jgi:hypothetical protein
MSATAPQPTPLSGFNLSDLKWYRFEDKSDPDWPIDTWTAIYGLRPDVNAVDIIVKLEPNAYYPYHRHIAETISVVLEGEHHVIETTTGVHKIRPPGNYGRTPAGDTHKEYAGPQGSLVFFSAQAKDGRLFENFDKHGNLLSVTTFADIAMLHAAG